MRTMRRWLIAAMMAACWATTTTATAGAQTPVPPPPPVTPAAPANDAFASALELSAATPERTGTVAGATFEAGEPNALAYYATGSLWFTYTSPTTRTVVFGTCGSTNYPDLQAYTGSALASLVPVDVDYLDQYCNGGTEYGLAAQAGVTYRIQLTTYGQAPSDTYKLSVDPPAPNDHAEGATSISDGGSYAGLNTTATADPGEPDHAGQPAQHSVWFATDGQAGVPLVVAACASAFDTRLGSYVGGYGALQELGSNDDSTACGATATTSLFRVTPAANGRVLVALDGKSGATGRYVVSTLHNDDRRGATPFTGWAWGSNRYATHETGEPAHAGVVGDGSVWYRMHVSTGQRVRLTTCSAFSTSTVDTILAAYLDDGTTLTPIASNDDDLGCASGGSRLNFSAASTGTILIAVDSKNGAGNFTLSQEYAPANDDRAAASSMYQGFSSWSGSNVGASKEAGEPDHAGNAGGASVWYSWRPIAGHPGLTVCGAPGSSGLTTPLLGVYTGTGTQPVASAAASAAGSCAHVSFTADGTTSYLIAVDGRDGATGSFSVTTSPGNDDFSAAQLYDGTSSFYSYGTTVGATAEPDEPAHGAGPAKQSVWYRFNATDASPAALAFQACGATSTGGLTLAVHRGTSLSTLTPVASGSSTGTGCARVRWTRAERVNETYWFAVDSGTAAAQGFYLYSATVPANDDFANAQSIGIGYSTYGSTPFASREAGEPDHAGAGGTGSLWYTWTASSTETVQLDTCGSYNTTRFDSVVAVYSGTAGALTDVAHGDDTPGCGDGHQPRITFAAVAGTTYKIAVDGHGAAQGDFVLRLRDRPGNDDRANAYTINYSSAFGSLDLASKEAGEPDHAGDAGGHSIWWSWTPQATGPVVIEACGYYVPGVDTLLAVYRQGSGGTLTPVAADDDSGTCASKGSRVTFEATAGTRYLLAVDGKGGAVGDVTVMLPPANDHLAGADAHLDQDAFDAYSDLSRATAETGEPAHGGTAAHRSVWYAWKPTRSDYASVDTCGSSGRVAVYTGAAIDALEPVTQQAGSACPSGQSGHRARFQVTAGTTYRIAVDDEGTGFYYPHLVARMAPLNDRFAAATDLGSTATNFVFGTTLDASVEPGEPDHALAGGGASVWYRWTAPRSATLRVDTCGGTSYDSVIAVYSGSAVEALTTVGANDDTAGCGDGKSSRVRVHVDAGTTYRIAISGHGAATGPFTLTLQLGPLNDDLAAAQTISGGGWNGTTVDAGDQAGEPDHGGLGGDHSVWYQFGAGTVRNVEVRACATGSAPRPGLAVYEGTAPVSPGNVTAVGTASSLDVDANTHCRVVRLRRVSGMQYVAVDGDGPGAQGAFSLSVAIAPVNDDRDLATDLGRGFTAGGLNVAATAEDGEPARTGVAAARSVWYRFTPAYTGPMTLETCGATFDTVLAVYATGSPGGEPTEVAAADDGCGAGSTASRLRFTAQADTTYLVAVDGKGGASGSFTLGFPPPNDLFAAATALAGGDTALAGGDLTRAGDETGEPLHAGTAVARSVWYRWMPPRSGAVTISTCLASSVATRIGVYAGTAVDALTPVASGGPVAGCAAGRGARVRMRVVAGTTYRIAVDADAAGTFSLLAALAPLNDDRADATVLGGPATKVGDTTYAQAEDGEPAHGGHAAGASVWFAYTPDHDGSVTVKTCASSFDTVLGVYTGTTALTPVASADDGADSCGSGTHRASLTFPATSGTRYLVALDGRDGATGAYELAVGSPANDDFDEATTLTGAHASGEGTILAATRQSGEPTGGFTVHGSIWWSWTAPTTGTAEVNACGTTAGAAMTVYRGSALSSLTQVAAYAFDGRCGSRMTFPAEAGTTYKIQAVGTPTDGGRVRVQVNPPSNDAFTGAKALGGTDDEAADTIAGASVESGEPTHGTGTARRSVWYSWTAPQDGRFTVDTCGSPTPAVAAIYRGGAVTALERVDASGKQATCSAAAPGTSATIAVAAGTVYRIALDGSGNDAGATLVRLHLAVDDVPPTTTFDIAPGARTNDDPIVFAFSANESATFECRLDTAAFAPCTSPVSRPDVAEGDHVFDVRATDEAGNVEEAPAQRSFAVDRTPPALTIDAEPPAIGRDTTVAIRFSSPEASAAFACSRDGAAFAACTSPLTLSGLDDGPVAVRVRAHDDLGNTSATKDIAFVVDTKPPTAALDGSPEAYTSATTAHLTLSADESPVTYACRLDEATAQPCTSPVDLTGLSEGGHTFHVTATDAASNVQEVATTASWTVDVTPPATTASAAPDGPVRTMPAFTLTSSESPAAFTCKVDDADWAPCISPYLPSGLADGSHTIAFRAVDRAGNVDATPDSRTFTVDTTPPTTTLDSGPSGVSKSRAAAFSFHASEAVARYECALGGEPASCTSPQTYNNLTDATRTFSVRAVDLAGNVGDAQARTFTVDTTPPTTTITAGPDGSTNDRSPSFGFGASEADVRFECAFDTPTFTDCASDIRYSDLPDGEHHLSVRAIDAAGNVDATPETRTLYLDTVPPDTVFDEGPAGPVHHGPYVFKYHADGATTLQCRVDAETEWRGCAYSPSPDYRIDELAPGAHVFYVRGVDPAGNVDPTPASRSFTIADAAPTPTLSVTPEHGPSELHVTATVGGSDPDGDTMGYLVDWGDGTSTESGVLPHAALGHTYRKPGTYVITYVVRDAHSHVPATRTVGVSLPEPLHADAGEDLQAFAGRPVTLDGGNSRPLAGIDRYHWEFGDAASDEGVTATHAYATPGTYTARLTVHGGADTESDTVQVVVLPEPVAQGLTVTVKSTSGAVIGGADVAVTPADGPRVSAVTDGQGHATLHGLADGTYSVAGFRSGFRPARANATVAGDHGDVTVTLDPGEIVGTQITSKPMTLEEIKAAGIDTNDPANQHAVTFAVHLELAPFLPCCDPGGPSTSFGGVLTGGGFQMPSAPPPGLSCTPLTCKYTVAGATVFLTWEPGPDGTPEVLSALVIPFKATWLKEFYDVKLVVTNLAGDGFDFKDGAATLTLPPGLSLAPTAQPQTLTRALPDVPGNGSAEARWVVRGDEKGFYKLSASYGARLSPFDRSIRATAAMTDPLHVWGSDALKLVVSTDELAQVGSPFHLNVKMKNVADVPVYNPSVEMLSEGRHGYIEQPRQQDRFETTEIKPGETFDAGPYILVPQSEGDVDLAHSFIQWLGGDSNPEITIETHPRVGVTPRLSADEIPNGVALDWEPVAGATGYEIYRTKDLGTPFGGAPIAATTATSAEITGLDPDAPAQQYAVSAIVGGRNVLRHPVVEARPGRPPEPEGGGG
ncbi:MAG: putative internalin, partial [Conexibacter sp.]|nr:putative internalin [Conexibacter sp.]